VNCRIGNTDSSQTLTKTGVKVRIVKERERENKRERMDNREVLKIQSFLMKVISGLWAMVP
jgi:hypothetical protein